MWSHSIRFSMQIIVFISSLSLSHECYIPCPYNTPLFDDLNTIWWSIQLMKLLIMHSSPVSCHFLVLQSDILHSSLFSKYLQSVFFP
jgi:hypothetical protein